MNKELDKVMGSAADQPPAVLGGGGIEGMEEVDSSDIRIPRIKLLQGTSKETKDPEQYPDLRTGMLINTLSKEELKKEKKLYPFVPVKMFKSWIKFNAVKKDDPNFDPNFEPGALMFQIYDKNAPQARTEDAWRYRQINFLGFQPSNPKQPLYVAFGSTSYKTGQGMIDIVQLAGRPLYEHLFMLGSATQESNGNTYSVFTAKSSGIPKPEIIANGRAMYQEFNPILADMKSRKVELDVDTVHEVVTDEKPF